MDAASRSERARKAALAMHAKHDGHAVTAKARETFLSRFADEDEKSQYFREMAERSNRSRRSKEI